MDRSIDIEISLLKAQLLEMGGLVERAVEEATQALINSDITRIEHVFQIEEEVNQYQKNVDESCLRFLATQAPLAADLRFIMAVIKINNDLERLGDQAVNIAYQAGLYLNYPSIKPLVDLPRMAEVGRKMLREALDSFVRKDRLLAERVLAQDDELDALKDRILDELADFMAKDSKTIGPALSLILIARNLERVGDHATNIAEDVIFVISGEDVRHGS